MSGPASIQEAGLVEFVIARQNADHGSGADVDGPKPVQLPIERWAEAETIEHDVEFTRPRENAVGNIGHPVDVIVMRTERFERTKRLIGGIAYPANKYGRVIYAAA